MRHCAANAKQKIGGTHCRRSSWYHIIQETDQSVGIDHRGYYKLSNAYVVDMLALTGEEIKKLGIGQGLRRAADRKAARDKKKKHGKRLSEVADEGLTSTYEEIAEVAGVSRRT